MALFTDIIELQPQKKLSSFTQIMAARRVKKTAREKQPGEADRDNSFRFNQKWSIPKSTGPAIKGRNTVWGECNCCFTLFAPNVTSYQLDERRRSPGGHAHVNTLQYTGLTGELTRPESRTRTRTNTQKNALYAHTSQSFD